MDDDSILALFLHNRPPTTSRAYRGELERLREFLKPAPRIAASLGDLQRFADSLQRLAPRTQCRVLSTVRAFYAWAKGHGLRADDPAESLRSPKVANDLAERILSPGEVGKILAHAETHRDYVAFRLLYICGLRASELCALTWRNFIRRPDGDAQLTVFGKGGKTRPIVIPLDLATEIAGLKGWAADGDPIFPAENVGSQSIRPIGVRQMHDRFKAAARRAGLERASMHWLRHAHASHTIDNGAPIAIVAATLGHSNIATTSRYIHARPDASSSQWLSEASPARGDDA